MSIAKNYAEKFFIGAPPGHLDFAQTSLELNGPFLIQPNKKRTGNMIT